MEKVRYMISDAAAMAGVETHVLRYWEEELDLTIPRNEMGHRYYTRENILEFQKIKELKEQGYQLKAIRMIIHSQDVEKAQALYRPDAGTSDGHSANDLLNMPSGCESRHTFVSSHKDTENGLSAEERMAQFRELMSDIVGRAIAQNNEELSLSISQEVRETVLKEMNYLFREQEESQEERYRKLDAAIRSKLRKKHSLFSRKDKSKKVSKVKGDAVPTT